MPVDERQGGPESDEESTIVPELTEKQREEVEERSAITALVVHEAVRHDGDEELQRPVSALAWSGLAAGLSMGFSFAVEGLLRGYLPAQPWRTLIVNLGYPVGFLIVILGRQQLFTENTLTAMIPLLAKRNLATFAAVLRLWAVVLVANLIGAHIFAWVVGNLPVFKPEVESALRELAIEAAKVGFGVALLRGIFAGWLIAMVVWILAATENGHTVVIVILTYVVGLAGLTHVIAGSVEVLFLVAIGAKTWGAYAMGYLLPTLLGNIIGGVSLVSAVNHAQVVAGQHAQKPASRG